MYLNDRKVYKLFGRHPERGKPLPWLPKQRVTVGVRWSLPRQRHEPDTDVHVAPVVALIRKGPGQWDVRIDERYREQVELWLIDNCL